MAVLARKVLEDAAKAADTAEALTILMEPHLQKRYGDSAIYAYTNERSVPPGDVLLAAALATGISLDEKLGIVRQETEVQREVEELRLQVARMREEMAGPRPYTSVRHPCDIRDDPVAVMDARSLGPRGSGRSPPASSAWTFQKHILLNCLWTVPRSTALRHLRSAWPNEPI